MQLDASALDGFGGREEEEERFERGEMCRNPPKAFGIIYILWIDDDIIFICRWDSIE